MTKPVRIQLSRQRGFRLQEVSMALNGLPAVKVTRGRTLGWGNPCKVGMFAGYDAADAVADYRKWMGRCSTVRSFDHSFGKPPAHNAIRVMLRGKNLACFCALDQPCHADVLLEIANA
jgi:hypothetical protein